MGMKKINANNILFIKLGEKGVFAKDCIENNYLRLSYTGVDHNFCMNNQWELVSNYFLNEESSKLQVATSHTNQIRKFYNEGEKTLWITFHLNKLWWCYSKPEIKLHSDKTKTRPVIGKWSDKDLHGNVLLLGNINGKLLKTQGFRGTICTVEANEYTVRKINNEELKEVIDVKEVVDDLRVKLSHLIQDLQWKDFETLIDLIFRQAGWNLVGERGKTQKTLDLELLAPVTGQKAIVQIKSQSDLKEFLDYQNNFELMSEYDEFFYVVHSPKKDLKEYQNTTKTKFWFVDKISEMTISSGLIDWLINKVS